MMKRFSLISVLVVVLVLCASVVSFAAEEIIILFGGGYPPFYTPDIQEGMYIDFLKEFEKQYPEFLITMIQLPRIRMDMWMETGKAQAFSLNSPLFIPEEQKEKFLFTDTIWYTTDHVIMRKGHEFPFEKPEDLFGKRIGVILGNGYGEYDQYLNSGQIKAERVEETFQLHQMLLKGRVDAIFGNKHSDPYQMKLHSINPDDFVFSEKPLYGFDLVCQVQKTHQHFLDKLNAFIKQSRENGFFDQLEEKYLR